MHWVLEAVCCGLLQLSIPGAFSRSLSAQAALETWVQLIPSARELSWVALGKQNGHIPDDLSGKFIQHLKLNTGLRLVWCHHSAGCRDRASLCPLGTTRPPPEKGQGAGQQKGFET